MKSLKVLLFSFIIASTAALTACGSGEGKKTEVDNQYPLSPKDKRRLDRGKVTGEGGINLFGGSSQNTGSDSITGAVNAYLWKASLDVVSFMPISSVDALGGVIITDWYEDPQTDGERIKANILIKSKELRASGVNVSLFRQELKNNRWRDVKVADSVAEEFENKILERARELRIESERR